MQELKDAKVGEQFMWMGNVWQLDEIYEVSEDFAREHNLMYRKRYKAHIVVVPEEYEGIREIDAAYTF